MKNLGRTIDKILKVDPSLEKPLIKIKNRWKRRPSMQHWEELLSFLNSDPLMEHPDRETFRDIITSKPSTPAHTYTFEKLHPQDNVLGILPENLADAIRRHDRKTLKTAKKQVEAAMTHNMELRTQLERESTLLEISAKKIWLALKDHFDLWGQTTTFTVKKGEGETALVLVSSPAPLIPPSVQRFQVPPNSLFRMLGLEPPPSPSDGE